MTRKARKRAAAASAVALAIGLVFSTGLVHGVWANFEAETQNSNSAFAGDYVDPPTLGTASANGLGATLTWTAGTHNVTNQDVWSKDITTSTSCSGVTYASVATNIGATATTIAGTSDAGSNGNGDNVCYQVRSTNTSGWYTVANFAASVQVGLVATGVSNDGASHQMTNGTHIFIDYNQNISYSGNGTVRVCFTSSSITIGGASSCTATVGTLSGGSSSTSPTCTSSTVSASGSRLTVLLGGCPTNGPQSGRVPTTMSGTATYVPTGTVVTSTAGSVNQCTTTGTPTTGCQPQTTY